MKEKKIRKTEGMEEEIIEGGKADKTRASMQRMRAEDKTRGEEIGRMRRWGEGEAEVEEGDGGRGVE